MVALSATCMETLTVPSNFKKTIQLLSVALAAPVLFSSSAWAATVDYDISFGATSATFQAPMGGGAVTGLSVTLGGVTFDTPEPVTPPLYDPVTNDISAAGSLFGYYSNSITTPGCPVNQCVLEFETAVDAFTPPVYAAFNSVAFDGIISGGFYIISPSDDIPSVPLPASMPLLILGMVGLEFRRRWNNKLHI